MRTLHRIQSSLNEAVACTLSTIQCASRFFFLLFYLIASTRNDIGNSENVMKTFIQLRIVPLVFSILWLLLLFFIETQTTHFPLFLFLAWNSFHFCLESFGCTNSNGQRVTITINKYNNNGCICVMYCNSNVISQCPSYIPSLQHFIDIDEVRSDWWYALHRISMKFHKIWRENASINTMWLKCLCKLYRNVIPLSVCGCEAKGKLFSKCQND